ncbi:hypothetical protein GHT06_013652 [Daphnia sinensis]|uniref:Uncharacterized protein n=1 Tax=Daphnia sinensis TaxID=1820382 RepID=A0AAD5KSI2_9CRUS|nr:hypothetical protein GHT06_013652 [Daphnia sinensis]
MAVQQLIWIALIGAVIVNGFPVKSPQAGTEDERLNYEKYVRQLEKKHKFAYNDIDQPWQPIAGDDSVESHEIILQQDDFVSVKPVVRDTKHQTTETPVIAADAAVVPVTEAQSQVVTLTDVVADVEATTTQEKILADPVDNAEPATTTQEKLLADVEDDAVSVTTTHEKLLADAEDDAVSVTTTHEKLLADEVLGQSDTATEQDVATISPVNEPVEESTTLSVLKVALIEESLVKVAQVEESDISEGSGRPLIDSTNADEGSGAAEVFKIDAAEGSGSTDELFKEIQTTIQPEISNDEVATETESTLLLNNDGLAGDETDLAITTEAADTKLAATVEQQLDEKEVKPTDSPSADEAEQTEAQPSSAIKIAHADDSIEAVTTDSSIAISDVRLDSTTKDSAEPEESTTLINIVLKDEIVADEATQEITTEQPDSHPVSTQSGF